MRWPSKESRERVKLAEKEGWEFVGFNGKGHPRIRHKDSGTMITFAGTPGHTNGRNRFLADLKRHTVKSV
jgi:predicted RNA binding protein YcfA (HicA-like mRNA interferase family)